MIVKKIAILMNVYIRYKEIKKINDFTLKIDSVTLFSGLKGKKAFVKKHPMQQQHRNMKIPKMPVKSIKSTEKY